MQICIDSLHEFNEEINRNKPIMLECIFVLILIRIDKEINRNKLIILECLFVLILTRI